MKFNNDYSKSDEAFQNYQLPNLQLAPANRLLLNEFGGRVGFVRAADVVVN